MRHRCSTAFFSSDIIGGVMLVDTKYDDVKQIESRATVINAAQKAAIEENVYTYFNTNKEILQSSFNEDEWNAYYEGELEPFAIQLSLVLTNMLFSPREQAFGNSVFYSANRLQYASNNTSTRREPSSKSGSTKFPPRS